MASPSHFLLLLLRRSRSPRQAHPQGLTLLECLMAIVVVAITVATITPPIFLATATRIQSRRAEQANQIAQGEIDRIRQLLERGAYTEDQLPSSAGDGEASGVAAASGVDASLLTPANCDGATRYPGASPAESDVVVPVDIDGDCQPEFAMQVFRTNSCLPGTLAEADPLPPPYGFDVGVRVYGYQDGDDMSTLSTDRARLGMTTARGDGGTARRPLQVLYSRVARTNTNDSLECTVAADAPAPLPPPP